MSKKWVHIQWNIHTRYTWKKLKTDELVTWQHDTTRYDSDRALPILLIDQDCDRFRYEGDRPNRPTVRTWPSEKIILPSLIKGLQRALRTQSVIVRGSFPLDRKVIKGREITCCAYPLLKIGAIVVALPSVPLGVVVWRYWSAVRRVLSHGSFIGRLAWRPIDWRLLLVLYFGVARLHQPREAIVEGDARSRLKHCHHALQQMSKLMRDLWTPLCK